MDKVVLIAAGGTGSRMQSNIPKQFLLIHNKPILFYTIHPFLTAYPDMQVVLSVPKEYMALTEEIMQTYFASATYQIVAGGSSRYHSVQNGIESIRTENAVVFVQDAARCLLSVALIKKCYEQTLQKGNAVPVILPSDSMRIMKNSEHKVLNRAQVRLVQTPQTFYLNDLKIAFKQAFREDFTDEATVMESIGKPIYLIEGEIQNLKITTPLDVEIARIILEKSII